MKSSSEAVPPRPPDRAQAWAWLLANLLVFPGVGTALGRRRSGWPQMGLALAGVALSGCWLFTFARAWVMVRALPTDGGPWLTAGICGVGMFLVAWVWSLASGLRLMHEASK